MSRVVISQPYYFPWVGLLEQIKQCDIFVHYDDVQFVKRHFMDRVQVPADKGIHWMTVPKKRSGRETPINGIVIDYSSDWRRSHLDLLRQAYRKAPFRDEMLSLFKSVIDNRYEYLADLTIASVMALADYFGIAEGRKFHRSSDLGVEGRSSERLADICTSMGGTCYITAMGALRYLDYSVFEKRGVEVEFIDYKMVPYSQAEDGFNPYVTALDLVAYAGNDGREVICSETEPWRVFVESEKARRYLK